MKSLLRNVPGPPWSVLLWLCLAGSHVLAQPDDGSDAPDGAQDPEQEVAGPQGEIPVTDQPGGLEAASESVEGQDDDEENGTGAGRFIPSEQISQDLGVSFPADI